MTSNAGPMPPAAKREVFVLAARERESWVCDSSRVCRQDPAHLPENYPQDSTYPQADSVCATRSSVTASLCGQEVVDRQRTNLRGHCHPRKTAGIRKDESRGSEWQGER